MKIRLKGKNRHGKNRVREHGDLWEVVAPCKAVLCLDMEPGWFIKSLKTQEKRWVKINNDVNFELELV